MREVKVENEMEFEFDENRAHEGRESSNNLIFFFTSEMFIFGALHCPLGLIIVSRSSLEIELHVDMIHYVKVIKAME